MKASVGGKRQFVGGGLKWRVVVGCQSYPVAKGLAGRIEALGVRGVRVERTVREKDSGAAPRVAG